MIPLIGQKFQLDSNKTKNDWLLYLMTVILITFPNNEQLL